MKVAPLLAPRVEICPPGLNINVSAPVLGDGRNSAPLDGAGENESSLAFRVDGYRYVLYKKDPNSRNGSYLVRFMFNGKKYKHCLKSNVIEAAVLRAKEFIRNVRDGKWADVERLRNRKEAALLSEIADAYLPENGPGLSAASCSRSSAENNLWALGRVLRLCLGYASPLDEGQAGVNSREALRAVNEKLRKDVRVSVINKGLAADFQKRMVAHHQAAVNAWAKANGKGVKDPEFEERLREARERALCSSRSILNQARSVFRSKALGDLIPEYKRLGLVVPEEVAGFCGCKLLGRLDYKGGYRAPNDGAVEAVFADVDAKLKRDARFADAYVAFWLGAGAGLRRKECLRMRWDYLALKGGEPFVSGPVGKNGEPIDVRLQRKAYDKLMEFKAGHVPAADADGWMIRCRGVSYAKRLNEWLGDKGFAADDSKKMHVLREYLLGKLVVLNPMAAKEQGRHGKLSVIEQHYSAFVDKQNVAEVL